MKGKDMKLSEAMMLGSTIIPGNDGNTWTTRNKNGDICAGCAIGMALAAIGEAATMAFYTRWPWLEDRYSKHLPREWYAPAGRISNLYFNVYRGAETLDSLIQKVAAVEPDCGECNKFECTCPKTAAVDEHQDITPEYSTIS